MNKTWASSRQPSFTIVELLIVIVVIGILAAITIVAYSGIQNRANDTAVQQDLRNVAQKLEEYRLTKGNDQYPAGVAQITDAQIKVTKGAYGNHFRSGATDYNLLYCRPSSGLNNDFAIVGRSKSGTMFQIRKGGAPTEYTGPWNGTTNICTAAGVSIGSTTNRDWFYHGSAWQV